MTLKRSQSVQALGYAYGEQRHAKLKKFLITAGIVLGVSGGLAGAVSYHWIKQAPQITTNKLETHSKNTLSIYSSDNKLLYTSNSIPYKSVTVQDVKQAKNLREALLSIEDRNFYHESGVNYWRTIKSLGADVIHHQSAGGSTITQQLVKLTYFGTSDKYRTVKRKVQEMYMANEINKKYSKDQILAFYMNKVYVGNNLYGMQTASWYYFNKPITKLNKTQAALLAGMIQQPTLYEPYRHYNNATLRRNQVLQAMYDNHKISQAELYRLNKSPLKNDLATTNIYTKMTKKYQKNQPVSDSFMTGLWTELNQNKMLDKENGIVKIKSSLNYQLQQKLLEIVNQKVSYPNDKLQVAVTVINNQNGQIVAQCGGRNQTTLGGFNRATQMARSSGSSIKPILDYAPAYDLLHWDENTKIADSPMKYKDGTEVNNWDNQYKGEITTKEALYLSRNIPAIKALTAVGIDKAKSYLKPSVTGVKIGDEQSSALGINTNTQQMAGLYTALANNGIYSQPTYLQTKTIGHKTYTIKPNQVQLFSQGASYMLTDALKMVPSKLGTAQNAIIDNGCYAGKTGTTAYAKSQHMPSDAISDAWYVGYCKGYTVAVWIGYDEPNQASPYLTHNQASIAQDIYKLTMQETVSTLHADTSNWKAPDTIKQSGSGYEWKENRVDKAD